MAHALGRQARAEAVRPGRQLRQQFHAFPPP